MKKVLVLAALLLIFLPVAAADFTATAGITEQTVCATDTILYVVSVQNTADSADAYTVTVSGDAAKWAVAAPAGFSLNPGAKEDIYVYVTPSSGAPPGAYGLKVKINGIESLLNVIVGDCHSVTLASDDTSSEVCADTQADYTITLTNTGKYTETLSLTLSGTAAKWSTLSDTVAKLAVGESKQIKATAIPPADQTGLFDLTVNAKAQNSNAASSLGLSLKSNNCYEFDLMPDKDYLSFCENSEAKIPLTLVNRGNVDNSYTLSVTGPAWASVENDVLEIPADSSKVTNLILSPDYGVSGESKVAVKIVSSKGLQVTEQTVTANVQTCYSSDLKIGAVEDTICPFTSKAYEVSLKNTGTFDERYAVTSSGADFAKLDKNFVDIKAGGIENINLLVDTKDVPAGLYEINLKAEAQNPSHAKSADTLTLKVAPIDSCFGVQTTAALTKVTAAPGEGTLVPVIVENKGSEESTYNLEVSGTGAAYAKLNPAVVTIGGMQAKTVYAYIAVPEETARQEYVLTVSARLADGTISSSSTITLDVVAPSAVVTGVVQTPQAQVSGAWQQIKSKFAELGDMVSGWFAGIQAKLKAATAPIVTEEQPQEPAAVAEQPAEEVIAPIENETAAPEEAEVTEGATTPETTVSEIPTQFLSPEAQKKLNAEMGIPADAEITNITITITPRAKTPIEVLMSWKNIIRGAAGAPAKPAAGVVSRIETNAGKVTSGTFAGGIYGETKTFLTASTYNIKNWMWIAGIIILLAVIGYFLKDEEPGKEGNGKKKSMWQKFMDWLEEEDEPVKTDEQKPAAAEQPKLKAGDILKEVEKEEQERKAAPRRRAGRPRRTTK
ncbi:MAG: hypothetical protein V1839_02280 [archaeon]